MTRAFVKYTKQGKIVPGSLILTQGGYPKGGPYKEITNNLCCPDECGLSLYVYDMNVVYECPTRSITYTYPDPGIPYDTIIWTSYSENNDVFISSGQGTLTVTLEFTGVADVNYLLTGLFFSNSANYPVAVASPSGTMFGCAIP